ncbi:MAG: hypothetical protein P4M12_08015 [Gammaproteobacteria bacterium]|nr:hypothetical protein [Gammaproteobacteria bacterium]
MPDCSGLHVAMLRENHIAKSEYIQTPPKPQETKESKSPAVAPDSASRQVAQTVLSNTIVLGADFATTSMPYGMALKAEALVRRPVWTDFLRRNEWIGAYKRTWGVLKYGFYPTFLLEVAATETTKQLGSPTIAHYSDILMPAIIGAGTAPAVSFAAINARHNLQLDIAQVLRAQGVRGVTRLTGGPSAIGLREAICYKALHHDTSDLALRIADSSSAYQLTSFLFKNKDNKPTLLAKLVASSPDALGLLVTQPLTMFAVNAGIQKFHLQQQPNTTDQKPKVTSPFALLKWQAGFLQNIGRSIMTEGKSHGLSKVLSFSPGAVARTASLFGTLTVFKYALEPAKTVVADNITHRKPKNA